MLYTIFIRITINFIYFCFFDSQKNHSFPSDIYSFLGLPGGLAVKNPPAMQEPHEMWVQSLCGEVLLEEGMATHSSILARRNPWTEEPVGYSPWSHEESDMTQVTEYTCTFFPWKPYFCSSLNQISLRLLLLEANLLFRLRKLFFFFFYLPLFNACNEYHIFMKTLKKYYF